MRRITALLLLIVTAAFQAEAVFGEVRDGSVHDEQTAEAWLHAHDLHGSHAHDGANVAQTRSESPNDGSEHEHGGTTDHCTHVHGVALVCPVDFELDAVERSFDFVAPLVPRNPASVALSPPPRRRG